MNKYLSIFIFGFGILLGGIIVNILAATVGLTNWFSFIENISETGIKESFQDESIPSIIHLFIIYPLMLGLIGYFLHKLIYLEY